MWQKKICFIDPHYYSVTVGGAEVQLAILAREFARRGWNTSYLTSDLQEEQLIDGVRIVPYRKGLSFIEMTKSFGRTLSDIRPAITYQRGR